MKRSHKIFLGGCSLLAVTLLTACLWNFNSPSSSDEDDAFVYLPLDDSEYPYANLQRLVIQTENAADVRNRETKVPAKLQIYGKDSPESFILDLEIRGRGNSSWQLSKYGYRLEFEHKVSLFGMPADKSWNLLSNQRDNSLVRNDITNQLAENLGNELACADSAGVCLDNSCDILDLIRRNSCSDSTESCQCGGGSNHRIDSVVRIL